jgi:hypothetical protein
MAGNHAQEPLVVETESPDFVHAMPMLLTQGACCIVLAIVLFIIARQFG